MCEVAAVCAAARAAVGRRRHARLHRRPAVAGDGGHNEGAHAGGRAHRGRSRRRLLLLSSRPWRPCAGPPPSSLRHRFPRLWSWRRGHGSGQPKRDLDGRDHRSPALLHRRTTAEWWCRSSAPAPWRPPVPWISLEDLAGDFFCYDAIAGFSGASGHVAAGGAGGSEAQRWPLIYEFIRPIV